MWKQVIGNIARPAAPTQPAQPLPQNFGKNKSPASEPSPSSLILCEVHHSETVGQFCCSCAQVVCVLCVDQEHQEHDVRLLKNVKGDMFDQLEELKQKLSEAREACAACQNDVNTHRRTLQEQVGAVQQEVNGEFQGLIAALKQEQRKVEKDLKEHEKKELKKLKVYEQLLGDAASRITATVSQLNLIQAGDVKKLLAALPQSKSFWKEVSELLDNFPRVTSVSTRTEGLSLVKTNISRLHLFDEEVLSLSEDTQSQFVGLVALENRRLVEKTPFQESLGEIVKHKGSLQDTQCAELCQVLRESLCPIEKLDLDNTYLNFELSAMIFKALHSNTSLMQLSLRSNNLNPVTGRALGIALAANTTLTDLFLQKNCLGPDGCQSLAQGLAKNTKLARLNLTDNNIQTKGCIALCRALKTNKSLTHLYLQRNSISDEALDDLKALFEVNTTLQTVMLKSNHLSARGKCILAQSPAKFKN
eukprot:m.188367 g.188367  ORF g.188367 m.188367 type:complete len:475 (-) comp25638_c0_seq4:40-1464(-)